MAIPIEDPARKALIALSLVPGLGPGRIRKLVSEIGSAEEVLHSPSWRLSAVPGIGEQTARSVVAFNGFDLVEAQVRAAERIGARMLVANDPEYPTHLREIYDPPAFLWIRGEYLECDDMAVPVAGTRRDTSYRCHLDQPLA